jgi:hypothetical protein
MEFPVTDEDAGGDLADEEAAEGSPESDDEVERCQVAGRGFEADHFAVANHAADEEGPHVDGDLNDDGIFVAEVVMAEEFCEGENCDEGEGNPDGAPVPAGMIEGNDKGEEVEGEGEHPEEGDNGDVLAHFIGAGEKEEGPEGSESAPEDAGWRVGWQVGAGVGEMGIFFGGRAFEELPGAERGEDAVSDVGDRPEVGLEAEAEEWFDDEGVADEGEEGSCVGDGVEAIGRFAGEGA